MTANLERVSRPMVVAILFFLVLGGVVLYALERAPTEVEYHAYLNTVNKDHVVTVKKDQPIPLNGEAVVYRGIATSCIRLAVGPSNTLVPITATRVSLYSDNLYGDIDLYPALKIKKTLRVLKASREEIQYILTPTEEGNNS